MRAIEIARHECKIIVKQERTKRMQLSLLDKSKGTVTKKTARGFGEPRRGKRTQKKCQKTQDAPARKSVIPGCGISTKKRTHTDIAVKSSAIQK